MMIVVGMSSFITLLFLNNYEYTKKLNLNKHPGDCVPYSLVAAKMLK